MADEGGPQEQISIPLCDPNNATSKNCSVVCGRQEDHHYWDHRATGKRMQWGSGAHERMILKYWELKEAIRSVAGIPGYSLLKWGADDFQSVLFGHNAIALIITPPTSFSQSRHSIDVTWRHTLSPRCTQRQKSVTGIHWNAYYRLNKCWWRDKFVIRSVSDVLRAQSRLVKCVGGSACGLRPHPPQILLTYFGPEVRQKQTL